MHIIVNLLNHLLKIKGYYCRDNATMHSVVFLYTLNYNRYTALVHQAGT